MIACRERGERVIIGEGGREGEREGGGESKREKSCSWSQKKKYLSVYSCLVCNVCNVLHTLSNMSVCNVLHA